jgi:hypothetical protein
MSNTPSNEMKVKASPKESPVKFPEHQLNSALNKLKVSGSQTSDVNSQRAMAEDSQGHDSSPRSNDLAAPLPGFDWQDFESRYHQSIKNAESHEEALMKEFMDLVQVSIWPLLLLSSANILQYFGVWTQAASSYDNDRSFKR